MARKLIEYNVYESETVNYSGYNSSKTVLGPMIYKFTGSSVNDYYIGPPDMKWRNITQDVGYSYFGIPHVVNYTDELDIMFLTYNYGSTNPFRVAAYFFNKITGNYTYLGLIYTNTICTSCTSTYTSPVATIDFYTAGTVSVSGTSVVGVNTDWGNNQITAGTRIGFGSTNPKEITNWYEIGSVPLETNRLNNSTMSAQVDSNGRVYIGGTFTTYTYLGSAYTATRIIRLNSDGSPDFTFKTGTGGFNGMVRRIKFDPLDSSKVYMSGDFTTYSGINAQYLIKLNVSDGSIDPSWDIRNMPGTVFGFNNTVFDFDFDSQNRIVATGTFTTYVRSGTTINVSRLCRLSSNGVLDTTFSGYSTGLNYSVTPASTSGYGVRVDKSDDKVYVVGVFNSWSGISIGNIYNVLKLNSNGTIDTSFANSGATYFNSHAYTVEFDTSSGGIYVGGAFSAWSGITNNNHIIKLTSGGTKDTSFDNITLNAFGSSTSIYLTSIKLLDNKLYINGNFTSYRGSTYYYIIKLNTNGDIDTTFNPETNTTNLGWLNNQTSVGDGIGVDPISGDVYATMDTASSMFGSIVAYTSGGTIEEKFYGKEEQKLTLTTPSPTYSAGTPYVIEDLRIHFSKIYNDSMYGGFHTIKGIKLTDFTTGSTVIGTTVSKGYYGVGPRTCYYIPNVFNNSGFRFQYSLIVNDKTNWNSQLCYALNYNNLTINVLDVRSRFRMISTNAYAYPNDVWRYSTSSGFDATLNGQSNPVIATTNHGTSSGVTSLFYSRTVGVRQIPLTNIQNGINPLTLEGTQNMSEVPPGNTTTYPASSSLYMTTYMPEIDRFIISTAAAPFKAYITKYNSNLNPPSLASTLWSRDLYNTLSYDNSFDRTFLVDGRQLQGPLSDNRTPKYPDIQGTSFNITSKSGWLHMVRPVASSDNIIYSLPLYADGEYSNTTNNVIITPKYVIPNLISITGFYLNSLKQIGSGVFSLSPEPIFMDFRTSGIDDNTGIWTNFTSINQLNGLLCNNTTNNITIQFRFRFNIAGITCNPNRLYGFTFTYEDDTTDYHYLPSISKSSLSNKIFAWRQDSLFTGNIPNMKVRVYNANTGDIILYDTVTDSNLGTWEYSTDGSIWNSWSYSANTVGNYIRYTANYLPSNYKLRVGLNQV